MTELVRRFIHRGADHDPASSSLEIEAVSAAYAPAGAREADAGLPLALEDVSFKVEQGEQVAVVGPNGAGKTTLLRLVAGLLKPERGRVRMFGHAPDEHICIAYVPQRSQINWSFPATVEDVVMMGRIRQIGLFRRPTRADRDVVRYCLERVRARHLAKKQISELSGGQQQRVFIARALALDTDLLLLDEPLAGLDLPSQENIFEILESLRPDSVTILVTTHDLTLAAERFDKVVLLNRRLMAFGPPSVVLSAENLVAAFSGHVHRLGDSAVVIDDCCGDGEEPDGLAG